MDITCEKCQSKFRIPEDKIPSEGKAAFNCPKCKNKITVEPPAEQAKAAPKEAPKPSPATEGSTYDASEKPFDFVEEEGKTALVCETDPKIRKTVIEALDFLEYHITIAETSRDALKKMRYHVYDLIVSNEVFDTTSPDSNGVLIYLERLNMEIRREIYVIMISKKFRTMDDMMAFRYSVNSIINVKNIEDFAKILNKGITDNELFYRVYKEALKEAGKV